MELPLVVGVDGSDSSLRAVDWAVDEAARRGLTLRLVHAARWERYEGNLPSFSADRPAGEVMADHIIASCAERARLRDPDVKVSGEVRPDDAASALLEEGRAAFAVITGNRGRSELSGMLLGSVSLAVAARALCPVIVVRGAERSLRGGFGRVVLAVGDRAEDSAAARFALGEARARGCELHAVRAWRRPAGRHLDDTDHVHEEQAARILDDALNQVKADEGGTAPRRATVEGPAHRVLLAASADADLLVVGALRRHGHTGLQLGRVSHSVLHHADCPVAVVPQQA
ncbi:universal stress protein [Streptomyces sp. NPDC005970]|uniref:universal stress protein n=1 Tax=Streptomyces sp. NPDC005970 TaxID=3156723 RepID=UPI0033DB7F99